MDDRLLQLLACPDDHAPLAPVGGGPAEALACSSCATVFPIVDGIPELLPRELRAAAGADPAAEVALRRSEQSARDEESGLYDTLYPDAEYRHELDTYVRLLGPRPDDLVLDLGAGTGRVVKEYAPGCARVVAADFSRASLARLRSRPELRSRPPDTILADATALPFAGRVFDRAACLSLVCFLPSDQLRARMIGELHRVLKPGGVLVLSTYHYAWNKRLWAALGRPEGALRQGFHSAGRIFYRNESVAELSALLEPHFSVGEIAGVCHRVPLVSRLHPAISRGCDRLLGRSAWGRSLFATEIVARATARP